MKRNGDHLENRAAHLQQEFPGVPPFSEDLAIMVSSDLSGSEHVNVTVNKANKLLGLVHRTISSSNPGAFSVIQISCVPCS